MEGAEDFIVVELEALGRFQLRDVLGVGRSLGHLLCRPLRLVVPVRILGGDARTPAASAVVVVVVRRDVGVVMRCTVAVARHVYIVLWCLWNSGRPSKGWVVSREEWGEIEDNKAS